MPYLILSAVLVLLPVGFLLEAAIRRMAEPDLFFYYALVERYLKTGSWPLTDPFLYTLPNDTLMTAHQWLGYFVFYLPYSLFGWPGPILLKTLVVVVFMALPLLPYIRAKKWPPLYYSLVWTLAIFISHHRYRERVSLFGDMFTLLLVMGLFWARKARWFWYSLPLLFVLWAQLHPSWPLGLAILVAYFCTRSPRTWEKYQIIATLLAAVVPIINPLWLDGYTYPFEFTRDIEPYLRQYVVEWLPLTDARLLPYRFLYTPFYTLLPFVAYRLFRQIKQAEFFEWVIFFLSTALFVKSVRFGLVAQGLVLFQIVHMELRQPLQLPQRQAWQRWATALMILVISSGVIAYKEITSQSWRVPFMERLTVESGYFPDESATFIEGIHPKMNIFNSFGFGGYLSWRWQGNPKLFFHGFSTNFKFYEEYYNGAQYSQEALDKVIYRYNIGVFLISKLGNDNRFIQILANNPNWQLIHQDGAAVVFAKKDPKVFQ